MKLGCCAPIEQYEELYKLGYDFIELSGQEVAGLTEVDVLQIADKIQTCDLPCEGFNAYCGENVPMVGPGYSMTKSKEYAFDVCRKGNLLGVRKIGIGSPRARILPEGYDLEKADKQMREFLTITAEEADKFGITVLYEALNPLICDYGKSTIHALEIVKELNLKNLFLVLDFHHMVMAEESVDKLEYVMPWVKHLHINGIGDDKRKHFIEKKDADFCRRALGSAYACGYRGTVSIEALYSADSFSEDAGRSLLLLREILLSIDNENMETNHKN